MTFLAILLGSILFVAGFAVHVVWWRTARPADDFRALALSLFVLPAVLATAVLLLAPGVVTVRETIGAVLVTIAIGAIYIMYYPAAQAASPSMLLVLEISRSASSGGATRESLRTAFDNELLCRQSIDNLVHEHFASDSGGKLSVAPRGTFLLQMLNNWRKLLGLKFGSG